MANLRSPNYPSLTLEESCEKIRQVYDQEHTHPSPREVIAQALGFGGLNGSSLGVLATLSRYGLLERVSSGSLKVSADAVSVLELDEGHPERLAALQRLAFAPKLFAELKQKFGATLPSDVNLRHFLIQEKSFLPKAADEVIRIYRENLELVTDSNGGYDSGATQTPKGDKPSMPEIRNQNTQSTPPLISANRGPVSTATKGVHEFSFPLSFQRDVKAVVTIYGDKLQRRDLEFLKKKVGDLLEGFDEEELEVQTRSAIWRNKDHDQPVTVTGELGEQGGKRFYAVKETTTGIPEDELEFTS